MGITKESDNKDNIINIWPRSVIYMIISAICVLMMISFILFPFWLLIRNTPINFLDFGYLNDGYIQFLIFLPMSIYLVYVLFKTGFLSFKISFTKTHIIVPKISEIQEKNVEIPCDEILNCDVTTESFYYFFRFTLVNGTNKSIFITRFSFKQMEMILKMIQERGGLIDQNINEIINPLRIRKKD